MKEFVPTTIMVIGKDTHFCYLMQRYVKKSGYEINMPFSTGDVVELVHEHRPAAIILEVDQPNTKGWDVLRALKGDLTISDIPVLLCTWMEDEKRAVEEGADITIRMPILYQDFLAALTDVGVALNDGEMPGSIK